MKNILPSFLIALTFIQPLRAESPNYAKIPAEPSHVNGPTETIALWPAGTAGIDPAIPEKAISAALICNIHNPTLTVYRPASPNGCAVVVCPGGAYTFLSSVDEGSKVGEWLSSRGITAFVLKYRLPRTAGANFKDPVPLSDALRAIQWVRSHAKDFNVDKAHIGIMGFSAGGHLAASAGTLFSRASEFGHDAVAQTSARPDFMALIYPVISNEKKVRHACLNYLLPDNATPEALDALSREKSVRADTSPAFFVHAKVDTIVPYQNSVLMHEALQKNGVASKLNLYEQGGHGFGLGRGAEDSTKWPGEFISWLKSNGFLGGSPAAQK